MRLSDFKQSLQQLDELRVMLPNGTDVPAHFHITEAGLTTKLFLDCGGQRREERYANLQIWVAHDTQHRLTPEKLLGILDQTAALYGNEDPEMEVEYQTETVGRYGVAFENNRFLLLPKETDCLAKGHCGVPLKKKKLNLITLTPPVASCCTDGACA